MAVGPAWGNHETPFFVPWWSTIPFALLLILISLLPVLTASWWESLSHKLVVSGICSLPVLIYLATTHNHTSGASTALLGKSIEDFVAFLAMVGSLYIVSGGIALGGKIKGRPLTNTLILGLGAILANLVSTVGASMLLIRPFLRANRGRKSWHIPVFFIFIVSNLGGLLLPLGDPPLFLGFLHGVDFLWTLRLWPQWLVANGLVLSLFFVLDTLHWRKSSPPSPLAKPDLGSAESQGEANTPLERGDLEGGDLRLVGKRNFAFLAGILLAVLLQSNQVTDWIQTHLGVFMKLHHPLIGAGLMVVCGLGSLAFTPAKIRHANAFSWHPLLEVAILFLGLFITMGPALVLLAQNAESFTGLSAFHYYWLTGLSSSLLDNAPAYMAFATVAAGSTEQIAHLAKTSPQILAAISTAAVFFGAMTYIGNGPNFMVQAIAKEHHFPTPDFLKYILISTSFNSFGMSVTDILMGLVLGIKYLALTV